MTLRERANEFQGRISAAKASTTLEPGREWYPWQSLAQMAVLNNFLGGDIGPLMQMIGRDPVLDVGCGDGDNAFFLESLGAKVDAVDYAPTNFNALRGAHALKQKLGSSVRIHTTNLDTRPVLPSPQYGFTLMLGLLYHLKNPFLVLEALARTSRYIFLSTRIAALSPDRKTSFGDLPLAYLVDDGELNNENTNFWIFSEKALRRIVRRSGWDVVHYSTLGPADTADPVTAEGDARAYILAKSRVAAPAGFRLLNGWHQLEYDWWRWTERRFSLQVDAPATATPATLTFTFQLPEVFFASHAEVTLTARINGTDLPARTYTRPGEHQYSEAIPALPTGPVVVEFELDRVIGPTDADQRELGVLVELAGSSPVVFS